MSGLVAPARGPKHFWPLPREKWGAVATSSGALLAYQDAWKMEAVLRRRAEAHPNDAHLAAALAELRAALTEMNRTNGWPMQIGLWG